MKKFTNVEMCRITEELIFQEPYQVISALLAGERMLAYAIINLKPVLAGAAASA